MVALICSMRSRGKFLNAIGIQLIMKDEVELCGNFQLHMMQNETTKVCD